jgi:GT2 family glycosyltransferase
MLLQAASPASRARVEGKFLRAGDEKLYVRGVTYGTFRPAGDGAAYPPPEVLDRDFALIAANGFNAVRTYTVPPRWLLDAAAEHGLRVMAGLPWEQHVAFLQERERARSIEQRVRDGVRACAGHPALLCYAVGNEIPASIVRWHGRRRIERFIERLYRCAKEQDPAGLVTYVNFPSTEYLELPFLDLVTFNVYLERRESLAAYLARLQNLAGDRPLILAEIGLDSRRNGEDAQADSVRWQVETASSAGCAGAFVFAWTDEWHRGGYDIEDWDFGLTTREREPKPALRAASEAFERMPPRPDECWPRISVVVCSCNGQRTLRDCFSGLTELDYPDFEVIVVNDGSTDATAAIAGEYPFRLINTPNLGLSAARNTGWRAATGEIVAYIDDDARPDPHWLTYVAQALRDTYHAGVGGPNLAPGGDGAIADCVANSPGGPVHVLLSDTEAEHIPGCNMALRREALEAVGGFDVRFRTAGDDVDLCWRLQEEGRTLGFHPAALVWHHRRKSIRAYWRQQCGYGKAEAMLEHKWPAKYNTAGHLTWAGRIYAKGLTRALPRRPRVFWGQWGTALFQSLYEPAPGGLRALPLMPEWYLLMLGLAALSGLGALWSPLLLALPLLATAVAAVGWQAAASARSASFPGRPRRGELLAMRLLTAVLHVLQPLARLRGRVASGLTPWRRRAPGARAVPRRALRTAWSETWHSASDRLEVVERALLERGAAVRRGGGFDRWELELKGGSLGGARLRMAVEEHGAGRQLTRFEARPRVFRSAALLTALLAAVATAAALASSAAVTAAFGIGAVLVALRALDDCAAATGSLLTALANVEPDGRPGDRPSEQHG